MMTILEYIHARQYSISCLWKDGVFSIECLGIPVSHLPRLPYAYSYSLGLHAEQVEQRHWYHYSPNPNTMRRSVPKLRGIIKVLTGLPNPKDRFDK